MLGPGYTGDAMILGCNGESRFGPSADSGGEHWICRELLAEDALPRQTQTGLARLFDTWQTIRFCYQRLPKLDEITPELIAHAGLTGYVHEVDVRSADPARFRYIRWGEAVTFNNSRSYSGLCVGDLPVNIYQESVKVDYNTAKMLGRPMFQNIRANMFGTHRSYYRLLLPCSDNGKTTTELLVAVSMTGEHGKAVR